MDKMPWLLYQLAFLFPITKLHLLGTADVPYPTLSWPTSLTAAKLFLHMSSSFHLPFLWANAPQFLPYQYLSPAGANLAQVLRFMNDCIFSLPIPPTEIQLYW